MVHSILSCLLTWLQSQHCKSTFGCRTVLYPVSLCTCHSFHWTTVSKNDEVFVQIDGAVMYQLFGQLQRKQKRSLDGNPSTIWRTCAETHGTGQWIIPRAMIHEGILLHTANSHSSAQECTSLVGPAVLKSTCWYTWLRMGYLRLDYVVAYLTV